MPTRLCFFFKSKDVAPGMGSGEVAYNQTLQQDVPDSIALQTIPKWRSVLSNFYVTETPILFRGQHYRTAEHIFQAMKIAITDKSAADSFAIESNSELSKGDGAAARSARKLRVLTPAMLQEWDSIRPQVTRDMWMAKFGQDSKSALVLALTGKAELWHVAPRMKPEHWVDLEALRV